MAFYDEEIGFTHRLLTANKSDNLYSPKIIDHDDNYIGQIPEDNLMFWKNSYDWSAKDYNLAKVKEYGVAYKNGIVIQYDVQSECKKYRIHYNFENNYKDNFDTPVTELNGEDNPQPNQTYYESTNKNCNFKWSMILKSKSSNVDLTSDFDNSKQIVTCGAKEYKIEIIKDNKYYLVKRGNNDYLP
ncbi:GSCOCT00014022001.2-RA-CDS [Cotesia congregata]|uniref:Cc_odve66_35 n=1 Tax=Cotesia congregata TaxID=51543 RepID=A0A8J2H5W0_COTCN|nr:GSCOCT00014022001.2-RA-CDS [Cotesia congregata]CAG5077221.1 Cc_odve66_35 [Cotesia congregata]